MARASTGGIRTKTTSRGTAFHARFRAYGQRREVLLGYSSQGMTPAIAEQELQAILVDVRRGDWQPFKTATVEAPVQAPSFHEFASDWLAAREASGLRPRTIEYLRWALVEHLLPEFASLRVDEFTIERVDRYARTKAAAHAAAAERIATLEVELATRRGAGRSTGAIEEKLRAAKSSPGLGNRSVNKTLDVLSAVLETAVEYDHLTKNPARGKRRRLPVSKDARSYLDTAQHIAALIDGATVLDGSARERRGQRRALLATLAFSGLRIGEALDLKWVDVNLADGKLKVRGSKTAAGVRTVDLLPVLRDELLAYKAKVADCSPTTLVFGTSTGGRQSETNVRRRILAPAVEKANAALVEAELEALPEKITPHSLRRTFASILAALGEPMPSVIRQLGHTDPTLTLRIYAQDMARGDEERARLRALVEGRDWGTSGDRTPVDQSAASLAAVA